jgi:DNA-binding Xre family transcriptional regulator
MPIRWKLSEVAKKKHLTAYALSAQTGISRQTLSKLMREPEVTRVNTETLDTLCRALHCTVGTLLEYVPD